MSTSITVPLTMSVSRPKVHRFPGAGPARKPKKQRLPGFLFFWGAVLLAALAMLSLSVPQEPVVKAATMLPAVAVVSNRILPVGSSLPAPVHEEVSSSGSSVLPAISDAQASTAPLPVYTVPEKSGSTIVLKDKSGVIVGQMARIPLENEQITEIKAINDVDNGGNRELLSIVGKY
jgi:hypothetical protein